MRTHQSRCSSLRFTLALFLSCVASGAAGCGESAPAPAATSDGGAMACQGSRAACSGACVDTAADRNNCGGCGHACSAAQQCHASQCVATPPTLVADTFPAMPLPLGQAAVDVSVTFSEVVTGVALGTTITADKGATLSGLSTRDNTTYAFTIGGLKNHQDYSVSFTSGIRDGAGTAFAGATRRLMGGNPTILPPAPGAGAMFGGAREGMILLSDGTVWDWGADFGGHLGDGNPIIPTDQYTPVQVVGPGGIGHLGSIIAIASGEPFNTALKSDGTVWTWGDNMIAGELGVGKINPPKQSNVPVQVHGPGDVGFLSSIIAIGSRGYFALAVAVDTTVWAWGMNSAGQLGAGNPGVNSPLPVHVQGFGGVGFLSGVSAVTGGYSHSLALKADGTVWAWGGNNNGQLGNGTVARSLFPVEVGVNFTRVTQVSAGWEHSLALKSDRTVWAWGLNDHGEIGNGCKIGVDCANVTSPFQVPISDVIAVSGGDCHSAALKSDGTVWTWGCNHHNGSNPAVDPVGQLGNGDMTFTDSSTPVQVHGEKNAGFLTSVTVISARDYHNYALKSDGTLWSWGSNLNGQLGNGTCCAPSTFPVQVQLP